MLLFKITSCNLIRVKVPVHVLEENSDSSKISLSPLTQGKQSSQTCHWPKTDFILLLERADNVLQLHLLVGAAFHEELKCATECHLDSVKMDLCNIECVGDNKNGVIFLDLFKFKKLYATISTFIKAAFNYEIGFYAYIMYQIKQEKITLSLLILTAFPFHRRWKSNS